MKKNVLDYQSIGRRLLLARQEKNITQQELAQAIGVSTSYIGHLERGIKRGSLDAMAEICLFLGLSMDHILFDVDPHKDRNTIIRSYLTEQLAAFSDSNHS